MKDKYVDNVNLKGINGGEYESYISAPVNKDETTLMREAVNRNQLTGNARFIDEIESITGRRYERRGQGRPAKD